MHFYAASAYELPGGQGHETFILMEYCPKGGLIDLMNSRLKTRLTEPEIWTIFNSACEAVAQMHALQPPLLHRDLKIENILVHSMNDYKLCDFGSAAVLNATVPQSLEECKKIEIDLNKHTTLQYRLVAFLTRCYLHLT